MIEVFAELGRRLADFGRDERSQRVIEQAVAANRWFTRAGIMRAVDAIRLRMLDHSALSEWLARYPELPVGGAKRRNVGVIMAGNIPLVGFSDLLCVTVAGHTCLYKPSSKDTPLVEYITDILRDIEPAIAPRPLAAGRSASDGTVAGEAFGGAGKPESTGTEANRTDAEDAFDAGWLASNETNASDTAAAGSYGAIVPDAVIATGSDNTNRYFRALYGNIPAIFRGSRSSLAVLRGDETPDELDGLADDIFSYSGLGCRNVSMLFVPRDYDVTALARRLTCHGSPNPKYTNNYRQHRALLQMQGIEFSDGGFFLIRGGGGFPAAVSEIVCMRYNSDSEVAQWIAAHDGEIQCIVGRGISHPRATGFGLSQSPSPYDYPDGVDIMQFLTNLP
ncbi:hypothetical protein LJC45_02390 [Alistipes sp. OttesenSCG-928-B03]|nr:hypothetical protein [Alistipes sp. OttesenSCG-928-B03]